MDVLMLAVTRTCSVVNCKRRPYYKKGGHRGFCATHGGLPLCLEEGCPARQSYKSGGVRGYCAKHGGHPACEMEGCNMRQFFVQGGKRGFCGAHGGIPRCVVKGCTSLQFYRSGGRKGFCGKHGGIPTSDPNKMKKGKFQIKDQKSSWEAEEDQSPSQKPGQKRKREVSSESEGDDRSFSSEDAAALLMLPTLEESAYEIKGHRLPEPQNLTVPTIKQEQPIGKPTKKPKTATMASISLGLRVAVACFECHRQKIKCESKRPCGPCLSRGLADGCRDFCKEFGPTEPKEKRPKRLADRLNPNFGIARCYRNKNCIRPLRHCGHCKIVRN
mmetsp:Transcript_8640/g.13561  ORF Transcript_8640/g.13561 Transcript_8640/m.13561 type:complete len:329 (-) Transcript_8640:271-1257(-)